MKILGKVGNSWSQIGGDIEGGEAAGDESDRSVSLSGNGNIVAMGARHSDGNGTDSGHVRVYAYNTTSRVKLGEDIEGEAGDDRSGESVSLCGNGTMVANPDDDTNDQTCPTKIHHGFNVGQDIYGEAAGDNFGLSAQQPESASMASPRTIARSSIANTISHPTQHRQTIKIKQL